MAAVAILKIEKALPSVSAIKYTVIDNKIANINDKLHQLDTDIANA